MSEHWFELARPGEICGITIAEDDLRQIARSPLPIQLTPERSSWCVGKIVELAMRQDERGAYLAGRVDFGVRISIAVHLKSMQAVEANLVLAEASPTVRRETL